MKVTDFLDQKRDEIVKRLNELRPLVDEYHRLDAASSALEGVTGTGNTSARTARRRGPGRPRGSRTARRAAAASAVTTRTRRRRATGRRPGRRKGSGARAAQTLQLVEAQPAGITIPELAAKMGIKQNYLYRVLPGLQKEGKVRKRGRTWFPRAA
jgi:hypothetical protein